MAYNIEDIEGIGEHYGTKLRPLGITTVEDLLAQGATPSGREALAAKSGIESARLLEWVNHADLFRVKGVAGQFAELLEAAGVDTVREFCSRVPENLHAKLVEVNESRHLVGRLPSLEQLRELIETAKRLNPVVKY